ncbi:23S rRNA (adenine(2030)-N(6))-methyltransferase RlmJ [Thioalkalivibrio sp. XN279]|uniref:23S rRNA (adenine(2030)-N(6))-methyltransferase RlmJ n=1 Tax=Thioalkalivibrio sp. XN279 TaxID=2714953 RepID=UPI00140AC666|nr:23S rRNA (adenine(2030)-N(6))-methyltransferase RlmJ [Thioalkalivibrio sp. XN279]NHA13504.1 23S rRNA (adenine(2030)-N(6))-methyltransferase RlmJ [Thioalkalivibrio sp. XN279]
MNYRHAFHAGNFADVLKHAVLCALLRRLQLRPKPLSYVETHAGAGAFWLDGPEARRSGEAADGILRLARLQPASPALATYLDLVRGLPGNEQGIRIYPGSPLVAARLLGAQDRLVLSELVPDEAAGLRRLFRGDARVAVHCRDGWEALGALLPPTPKRGLLLIDPPYEAPDDLERVVAGLVLARQRWPVGVLAAWYPVKDRRALRPFERALDRAELGPGGVLRAEVAVRPDDNPGSLNGSGMLLVAPPWGVADDLRALLEETWGALRQPGAPPPRLEWLRPPA